MENKNQIYPSSQDIPAYTLEQLKGQNPEIQKDVLETWFLSNYEDPAERTPYESAEGGYIYIWGGPYEAIDELFDEFGSHIDENIISEVADDLERFGHEWTRAPSSYDYDDELYSFEEQSKLYLPDANKIITNIADSVSLLINELSKNPHLLYELHPRKFEEVIAEIFSQNGFSVELTKQTRDGGKDIIAIRDDIGIKSKFLIECKRHGPKNPVSVDLVRNLYGVQAAEGANKSILATTSYFTQSAKSFAENVSTTKWAMDLKDYQDIVGWLKALSS